MRLGMGLNEALPRLTHRLIWRVSGPRLRVFMLLFYLGHIGDQRLGVGQSMVEGQEWG